MKIALIEPFYSGSHKLWADGLREHSSHHIKQFTLPGRHWKWRMHGGAVSLAESFRKGAEQESFDLILGTSMLDLSTFMTLSGAAAAGTPCAVYFHENQLTYPWSPDDEDTDLNRDNHYSYINFTTALTADRVFFNSAYHKKSFLEALPEFLQQFPDENSLHRVDEIKKKSEVLHLGMDLKAMEAWQDSEKEKQSLPLILWNHRWEYDKNPEAFFEMLFRLKEEGKAFKLAVLGEHNSRHPDIFDTARDRLKDEILHWGYVESREEYTRWLWRADILPVTSNQDFFGGSVVEAMYCDCFPVLPNRLAYPEHIPKKIRRDYLYERGELHFRLESAIRDFMMLRQVDYQSMVKKYDWSEIADQYDRAFAGLMK